MYLLPQIIYISSASSFLFCSFAPGEITFFDLKTEPVNMLNLQVRSAVARHLMSAVRHGDPCQCIRTMGSGRALLPVQPVLIEIQTGANEACNQIRAGTLGRLLGSLGIQAARLQGALAKYLEFTSVAVGPH